MNKLQRLPLSKLSGFKNGKINLWHEMKTFYIKITEATSLFSSYVAWASLSMLHLSSLLVSIVTTLTTSSKIVITICSNVQMTDGLNRLKLNSKDYNFHLDFIPYSL